MTSDNMESNAVLRLVLISDTHELHREVDVPPCDLLIHAGDATMMSRSAAALLDFDEWLGEIPARRCIVIPGNHDFSMEGRTLVGTRLHNADVLINQFLDFEGLKIWGSPVTPLLGAAFGMPSPDARRKLYAQIPPNTDLLITRGPPFGILDRGPGGEHQGCRELRAAVERVQPLIHCFGHVHGAHGIQKVGRTTFVNAAMLDEDGGISRGPVVLRIPKKP